MEGGKPGNLIYMVMGVKSAMTTLEDPLAESTKAEYRTCHFSDILVLGMHPKGKHAWIHQIIHESIFNMAIQTGQRQSIHPSIPRMNK